MSCKSCGARLYKNAKFCAHCGSKVETVNETSIIENENTNENAYNTNQNAISNAENIVTNTQEKAPTEKKLSGKAITGFVLSLCGFIIAGIPCGIIGIIFSALALNDIKNKNYKGKGFAVSGLSVSIVVLVISIFNVIDTISTIISFLAY